MRRVRGSKFFPARREHDARECPCRKEWPPWRVPRRARRLAAAGPWPCPHRLEPFRGEFVARIGRHDPKTFRSHPMRIVDSKQIILECVEERSKRKFPRPGLTEWKRSECDLSSVWRNCASNVSRND